MFSQGLEFYNEFCDCHDFSVMLIKLTAKRSDFGPQHRPEELELIIALFGVRMKPVMYHSASGGCCDCGDLAAWKESGYV